LPDRDVLAVATRDEVTLWDVGRLAEIVEDPGAAACEILGNGLGADGWEATRRTSAGGRPALARDQGQG
jgi:hypothetical protein